MDVLSGRIGIAPPGVDMTPEASRFTGRARTPSAPRVAGGVAVVSIIGTLVNRGAWVGASSGLVSYEGIGAQLREAANDPSVHSVIIDIDTGGGEAGGITAVAAAIRDLAQTKRVVAVVNDTACSGGYWLASAADEIVVSETSMVGSIGVVVLHVNRAGEMQQKGWAPTFIHAGAHKVDANPFEKLADTVRADIQAEVDSLRTLFCAGVAAGRGKRLTADQARATEARVFHGEAAIKAGLADRLGSFESVLAALQQRKGTSTPAAPHPAATAVVPAPSPAVTVSRAVSAPPTAPAAKPVEDSRAMIARVVARINQGRQTAPSTET